MPVWIPFVAGGLAVASLVKGVSDSIDGSQKLKQADSMAHEARRIWEEARGELAFAQRRTEQALEHYRRLCLSSREVLEEALEWSPCAGVKTRTSGSALASLGETVAMLSPVARCVARAPRPRTPEQSSEWLLDLVGGVGAGAASSHATRMLMGGALTTASGALGAMLLGGVAIAPVALCLGASVSKRGEKALTEAREVLAQARIESKQMELAGDLLWLIELRLGEMAAVLEGLLVLAQEQLKRLEQRVCDSAAVDCLFALALAIEMLLKTPVFDEFGEVTRESQRRVSELADSWCLQV